MTSDSTKTTVKRGTDCIGVTISFVCHDGHGNVLLHKRSDQCRDEHGKWDNGGGALEFGESFEEGLKREIREEYCADVLETKFLGAFNNIRDQNGTRTHWVNVVYAVRVYPEQVKNGEPHKIEELGWFRQDQLPSPPHTTLKRMVDFARAGGVFS